MYCHDKLSNHRYGRNSKKTPAFRSRAPPDEGVHAAGRAPRPRDDADARRGERLSRTARGNDDRRHLPGRRDQHGGPAPLSRIDPRGELCRTAGSIGESVAAGAIFTLPAFVIAGAWPSFSSGEAYWKSTALMLVGCILGVLFVSLVRRVMVEDPELPFPESVAAAEIHKAGQRGAEAAKYLFYNMGFGALVYHLSASSSLFAPDTGLSGSRSARSGRARCGWARGRRRPPLTTGGVTTFAAPDVSPAYIGVGYIIGPELASLQLLRRRARVGPDGPAAHLLPRTAICRPSLPPNARRRELGRHWRLRCGASSCGRSPWAACWWARRSRCSGCGRACSAGSRPGLRRSCEGEAPRTETLARTERYMSSKTVFALIGLIVSADDRALLLLDGSVMAGARGRHRDADRGLLLRHRFRLPGRADRLVEQPDLRADAVHADHRGAADGGAGRSRARAAWWWCWGWRPWCASHRRWPASCCRTSRSATSSAARRGPFRSSS